MPLAGSGPLLGAEFGAAGGCSPASLLLCTPMGVALVGFLMSNMVPIPGTLFGTSGAVAGIGKFSMAADGTVLGPLLAAACGSVDAGAITKWTTFATDLLTQITSKGQFVPVGWAYTAISGSNVAGSPATMTFSGDFSPALPTQMGFTDAHNITTWNAIGTAVQAHLVANSVIQPDGMFCAGPAPSPVTGIGALE